MLPQVTWTSFFKFVENQRLHVRRRVLQHLVQIGLDDRINFRCAARLRRVRQPVQPLFLPGVQPAADGIAVRPQDVCELVELVALR